MNVEQQFGAVIRAMWHGTPTSTEAEYIRDVRATLDRILLSRAGRALAAALRYQFSAAALSKVAHGKSILIMPFEDDDDKENAQEDGVTPGADESVVLITPGACKSTCSGGRPATLPHEIMHHELVHALRRVSGHKKANRFMDKLKPFTNSEELLAIMLTNIFISDGTNHHKSSLRAEHVGHGKLDPALADSFGYFALGTTAYNVIARFCEENQGYSRMVAEIPAKFNPVWAYYKNRRKAFEIAAGGDADSAFESMTPIDYFKAPDGAWKRIIPYPGPPARGVRR